jgi:hypothetical protein
MSGLLILSRSRVMMPPRNSQEGVVQLGLIAAMTIPNPHALDESCQGQFEVLG